MYDTEHYTALMTRLSHEKQHLENAKMNIQEYSLRSVWIKQIEKEIKCEVEFLKSKGIDVYYSADDADTLSNDELLKELEG